jgi:iron(III) transport system permease protein
MREPVVVVGFAVIALVLALFVVFPIARVIAYPRLSEFATLLTNSRWKQAIVNSFRMVLLSTTSATLVGYLFAYAITRRDLVGHSLLHWIAILPIFSPPFAVAFSYLLMFGRLGLITHTLLGLKVSILGWQGLWLAQTVSFFPFATMAILPVLENIKPSLEVAAKNLGASELEVFTTVTLPLSRPGLAGAALLVSIFVLADFGNPLVISGDFPLLSTEAWYRIEGWADLKGAALLVTTLLPPALLFFLAERYWVSRKSYATVVGKGTELPRPRTPTAAQVLLLVPCLLVSLLVFLVYLGIVVGGLTRVWGYDWRLSLVHWKEAYLKGRHLVNSMIFSVAAGFLSAVFGMITAYVVSRGKSLAGKLLDFVAVLPAAIPGVFIGIGYLLAFNSGPIILTGTPWIIVLALVFWNLPFSYQVSLSGIMQIGPELEQAAADLGASQFWIFWDLYRPLLGRSFIVTLMVAFMNSMTNLSIVVFLVTSRSLVATFSILTMISDNRLGAAAALTNGLLVVSIVVLVVFNRVFKVRAEGLLLRA